ncbi:hypothetical protein [Streptomyces macrosporus]|uniref:Uncharacterized protein n=1 Tax=Streptomyces macrosporus TaxID=44032 RepID=A0ABP5XIN5_9ACTN
MKRTYPNQADEGLRRVLLADAVNADLLHHLLTIGAEDLRNHQPSREFNEGDRIVLAHYLADGDRGQERQLLAHMPQLDRVTTRGEYSLILADAAREL